MENQSKSVFSTEEDCNLISLSWAERFPFDSNYDIIIKSSHDKFAHFLEVYPSQILIQAGSSIFLLKQRSQRHYISHPCRNDSGKDSDA